MNTITRTLRLIALCVMSLMILPTTATAHDAHIAAPSSDIALSGLASELPEGWTEVRTPTSLYEAQQFMPVVEAAWPDSPCAGQINIELVSEEKLREIARPQPGDPVVANARYDGAARVNDHDSIAAFGLDCTMYLLNYLHGEWLCEAMTHEGGHLSGKDHSKNPLDIMYFADTEQRYPPCLSATRLPREIATDAVMRSKINLSVQCWVLSTRGPNPKNKYLCQGTDATNARNVSYYVVRIHSRVYRADGTPNADAIRVSPKQYRSIRKRAYRL